MNKTLKRIFLLLVVVTAAVLMFSFSAAALQRGDVDEDGDVTPADARMALRMSVGLDKSISGAGEKIPYTDREKDIADMNMDLSVSPEDARVILRTAVKAEDALTYYAYSVIKAPTCTEPGKYERLSTGDGVADLGFSIKQEVPALGHDFSEPLSYTVEPTCTTLGTGIYKCSRCNATTVITGYKEHSWIPASCVSPKKCLNCGLTSGTSLGHTTMLGVCKRCGQYQALLLDYYNTNIRQPLNGGANALKTAYNVMYKKFQDDYNNKTNTLGEAIPYFVSAYNYYLAAYEKCGDYPEFAEAKKVIDSICRKLYGVVNTGKITKENYNKVLNDWADVSLQILDSDNAKLKAILETFKEPDTSVPVTNPEPTTNPPSETPRG